MIWNIWILNRAKFSRINQSRRAQQIEALQKLAVEKGLKEVDMLEPNLDFGFSILEALAATGLRSIIERE